MSNQANDKLARIDHLVQSFRADPINPCFEGPLIVRQKTDYSALLPIYLKIGTKFPNLYETLVLNYRWHGANVGLFRFLLNPPGPDLSGFRMDMFRDTDLLQGCLNSGFIQIGRGPGANYDPVCFEQKGSRIVQLDHESVLCKSKIKLVKQFASNFDELIYELAIKD
jgi:hypothetical protein